VWSIATAIAANFETPPMSAPWPSPTHPTRSSPRQPLIHWPSVAAAVVVSILFLGCLIAWLVMHPLPSEQPGTVPTERQLVPTQRVKPPATPTAPARTSTKKTSARDTPRHEPQ
jgi:hypothetical protein